MDSYESTRRGFIKKLGLSVGMAAAVSGAKGAKIIEKHIDFPLTDDQQKFIESYEDWMDKFVDIIKARRTNPDDLDLNLKLMRLSEQHESWQKEVVEYMKDDNFAKHYMIVTQRMTDEID